MDKKRTTHHCYECKKLIFSKKKINTQKKFYHITCYKNMRFENDYFVDEKNKRQSTIRGDDVLCKETHVSPANC